jgi:hypothetical protein
MPEKTIKRQLTEAGAHELADDDGPIFSTVAKLVDALQRAVPHSRDLKLREEALRLGRDLLRGAKVRAGLLWFLVGPQRRQDFPDRVPRSSYSLMTRNG